MKIAVVTTFNKKLYDQYAHNFLKSYFTNWPFDLYVYSEETFPVSIEKGNEHRLTLRNIFKEYPECKAFVDRNKDKPIAPPPGFENYHPNYKEFRHEAVRFSYKVYSYIHFVLTCKGYDGVICIDADSVFFKKVDENWFIENDIIKNDTMMTYMGRGKTYHMEAGFLYFNLKHKETKNFLKEMKRWYDKDLMYTVPEQHDSYIWDIVRKQFEEKGVINNDIGDGRVGHVQARSALGTIYDHVKGNKPKKRGYSEENIHRRKI